MRRLFFLCLVLALFAICRLGAQPFILTSFGCPDGCANPWNQVQGAYRITCPATPACTVFAYVDYQWRSGCQNAADIKILGWRGLIPGDEFCLATCSTPDILAKIFVAIVETPPPGFPTMGTAGNPCQDVVQFQVAHCYGYYWPVQGHPVWGYCDGSQCCRSKYVVCRDPDNPNRTNKVRDRIWTANPQVAECTAGPISGEAAAACDHVCGTVWSNLDTHAGLRFND